MMSKGVLTQQLEDFRKLNVDFENERKEKEAMTTKIAFLTQEKLRIQKKLALEEMKLVRLQSISDQRLVTQKKLALKIKTSRESYKVTKELVRNTRDALHLTCKDAQAKEVLLLEKMDKISSQKAAYQNLQKNLKNMKVSLSAGENHYHLLQRQNSMLQLKADGLINENCKLKKEALRSSNTTRLMRNYISDFKNKIRLFRTQLEGKMEIQDKRFARVSCRMRRLAAWSYAGAVRVRDVMGKEYILEREIGLLGKIIKSANVKLETGQMT